MEIQPREIQEWLKANQHSREWLADKVGTAPATVAGWLAANKPRPIPIPVLKLIERLMTDDLLGEPEYTLQEARDIRFAMDHEGYTTMRDFSKAAVIATARSIAAERSNSGREKLVENAIAFPEMPLLHAAAGAPSPSDADTLTPARNHGPGRFAVRLHGESMAPKYKDGSVVILRERESLKRPLLKKGEIYLFCVAGEKTLKVYQTRAATPEEIASKISYISPIDGTQKVRVLRSLNPEFPEIVAKEPIEWMGWLDKNDN
jgi:hypothetical protein